VTKETIILRTDLQIYCVVNSERKRAFSEEIKRIYKVGRVESDGTQLLDSFSEQLEGRQAEWCISSNCRWGIPVPAFAFKSSQKVLINAEVVRHVAELLRLHGKAVWWDWTVEELLPPKFKNLSGQLEKAG